jgi:chemotaxis protein histidine kinase CheA
MPGQLKAHLEQGPVEESSRLLHTLKGLAATMGAMPLSEQAAIAEKMMDGATEPADRSDATDQVCAAIHSVGPGLDALLSALKLELEPIPPAVDAHLEPTDANALRAALQTLYTNLHNSDMAALQSMADLQQRHGIELGEQLAALRAVMDNLDFASALPLYEALMTHPTT